MVRSCLLWLFIPVLAAAYESPVAYTAPLASLSAPDCPSHSGVRNARSAVVQLGDLNVSIGAQAVLEKGNCSRTGALWVTRGETSSQIQLSIDAGAVIGISDIAPDASAVLLTSSSTGAPMRIGVSPLSDGAVRWISISELLGRSNCNYSYQPQGFLDNHRISIAAIRQEQPHPPPPGCASGGTSYVIDPGTRQVKLTALTNVERKAAVVAEAVYACQSDPDVNGACYTTRARLATTEETGLVVWPVGSKHLLAVKSSMAPGNLLSQVNAETRVYATMIICPLSVQASPRPFICIESATSFKTEPAPRDRRTPGSPKVSVIGGEAQ